VLLFNFAPAVNYNNFNAIFGKKSYKYAFGMEIIANKINAQIL
jgi:hypothetical protein